MAQKSGFFNSVGGDRKYKAEEFADYFQTIISTGVSPASGSLVVTANNTMQLTVSAGRAFINGYYYNNDSDYVLTLDPSDAVLNRIDRIVLRLDYVNRVITLAVLKGTPASSPVAPALIRDVNKYELCIAEVLISAGVAGIDQTKVTDKRADTNLCGYMKGTVIFDENEELQQLITDLDAHKSDYETKVFGQSVTLETTYTTVLDWANAQTKSNTTFVMNGSTLLGASDAPIPNNNTIPYQYMLIKSANGGGIVIAYQYSTPHKSYFRVIESGKIWRGTEWTRILTQDDYDTLRIRSYMGV